MGGEGGAAAGGGGKQALGPRSVATRGIAGVTYLISTDRPTPSSILVAGVVVIF